MKEYPYLRVLTNLSSEIIKQYSNTDKDYSDKDSYVVNAFLSLGEIESVFEQLEQSPHFLSNFKLTKSLKENGISRFNHIIYHIESHLFRATGILDRMLIHINVVLNIGLSPENCRTYYLLTDDKGKEGKYAPNIKNKSAELFQSLLELRNYVNRYRELRNMISHQKRYASASLKKAEMYHIVQQGEDHNGPFAAGNYDHFIKLEMDRAVRQYKTQMLDFNSGTRKLLDKIFMFLQEVWHREYALIEKHGKEAL
jgi:hypothetical protein